MASNDWRFGRPRCDPICPRHPATVYRGTHRCL